jgi:hypothetical protein
MKNRILFIVIALFCFSATAQESVEKHLKSLTEKMFVDMNNRDYDAILNMTHPKVFDVVSKELMKTTLASTLEGNEEYSVAIPKTIPAYNVSKLYTSKENAANYAFVSYDMKMTMTFHKENFDDEGKEMMKSIMKSQGMDVTFTSNNAMEVLMNDRVTILLKDKDTNNKWVMINYDPDSPLTYQILSTNVIEDAKAYRQDLLLERKKKEE